MVKQQTEGVAIPEIAYKHIKVECGKVSRRFHLTDEQREELESHIGFVVRLAVDRRYDPQRASVYTFVQRVVHNQLCDWMDREIRDRYVFRPLTPEITAAAEGIPWDDHFLRQLAIIADVRTTVALLTGTSLRICRLYLECLALNKVCARMRIGAWYFYCRLWPQCRKDFSSIWKKNQSDSPAREK